MSVFPTEIMQKATALPSRYGFIKEEPSPRETHPMALARELHRSLETNDCYEVNKIKWMLQSCRSAMTREEWDKYESSLAPLDPKSKYVRLRHLLFILSVNLSTILESVIQQETVDHDTIFKLGVAVYLSILPRALPSSTTFALALDRRGVITAFRIIQDLGFPIVLYIPPL
jgi:hypothetical protein